MALPLLSAEEKQVEPVEEALPPGSRLMAGQYRVERFLNSGAFALVYLVRDGLGRPLVVKECFPEDFCRRSGELVVERSPDQAHALDRFVGLFLQEARTLSELDHPSVVRVHQAFEENNTAYMVMDYVDGPDLLDIIDDPNRTLEPAAVEQLLTEVLSALVYLHGLGVLHRDLSPDNIMVGPDGVPVLVDFGASRGHPGASKKTATSLRVVKDGYSPQELYHANATQDQSADLYGLAATFYHLITGEMPQPAPVRQAALSEGKADPFEPLALVSEGYSDELIETVDQALSLDPKDRPASAAAWLEVLSPARRAWIKNRISRSIRITSVALISVIGAGVAFTDPAGSSQRALDLVESAAVALADPYAYTSVFAAATPAIELNEPGVDGLKAQAILNGAPEDSLAPVSLPGKASVQTVSFTEPVFPAITLPAEDVTAALLTPALDWTWFSAPSAVADVEAQRPQDLLEIVP